MILLWCPQLVFMVTFIVVQADERPDVPHILLISVSSLLGVICYSLSTMEAHNRFRVVALNFAVFFEINAFLVPVWDLLNRWLFKWHDPYQYTYQYSFLLYFLLLTFSVTYLVLDRFLPSHRISMKYIATVIIAIGGWTAICHPYLSDPDYLRNRPEFLDFGQVRNAIADLKKAGVTDPSASEIASFAQLKLVGDVKENSHSTLEGRTRRVSDILPFNRGFDYGTLYWKPLYMDSLWFGLWCSLFLIGSMVFKFIKDPPEGAYVEKIIWCLLVYCSFEALHMYAYTQSTRWEVLVAVTEIGIYVSLVTMIILLSLFALRMRFMLSIEGNYYERRLWSDPDRVTRWRDAFDNWVLRQFMNPVELDRRFLVQHRTQE
jgi:hypothetical protein